MFAAKRGLSQSIVGALGRTFPICFSPYLYRARNLIERFFNRSSNVGVSRPDMTG
jgi:hypothetical protein